MPQLDPTSFSSQLFWLMVSFVVLYVLLARFLLPRVHSVIEFRTRTIDGDIGSARDMQSEAASIRDAYEKGMAETRAKSKTIISETKARIANTHAAKQAEMDAALGEQIRASEVGIAKAREDVRKKMLPVAGTLAENIVNIILRHKPDAKELDSVMAEVAKGGRIMNGQALYLNPEFWVAVSFAVVVVLVFPRIAREINKMLDARSREIADTLAEAKRLRNEAQALLTSYQKQQQDALREAEGILSSTKTEADLMLKQSETDLANALDKRKKLAMEKIAQAESKALQDVQNHVVDIAVAVARTIITNHLARTGSGDIVRQAVSEVERKLH